MVAQDGVVQDWTSYFDTIVVDACKPRFFADGTIMREVDVTTGRFKLGAHGGKFEPGRIYSGGGCNSHSIRITELFRNV